MTFASMLRSYTNKRMVIGQDVSNELHLLTRQLRTYCDWLRLGGIRTLPRYKQQSTSPVVDPILDRQVGHASYVERAPLESAKGLPSEKEPNKGPNVLKVYPGLLEAATCKGREGMDQIQHILGDCRRCKLHHGRNQIVFGQGDPNAKLVFVGEGPGAEEDRTGLPFVGAAGDLLNRMIIAMGFKREQVYICNVVKCRPPGNRTPEGDEVETCSPFLRAQLQVLSPKVIVALGATPTRFLLQTSAPMSRIRGKFTAYEGIPVMPTYHPAYLLRTPSAKKMVWEDLKEVMAKLNGTP